MQANVSMNERVVSLTLGSALFVRGCRAKSFLGRLMQMATGLGLLGRGLSGYCPLYRSIGREPLQSPQSIARAILVDRTIEEVREILGEGDPLWYESSRRIFPITAGNLLWDLHLEEVGDGLMTMVRASLSDQNSTFGLKTYLSNKTLRDMADAELKKLGDLIESEDKGLPGGGSRARVPHLQ